MRKSEKNKISLVTGGAGFIGSHVAEELLRMGHEVIVVDDLSGGFLENIPKGCIFIKGSVTNEKIIENIFKKYQIDYVFHLAAYAAEGLSHFIRKFNYENNVVGSINVINSSIRHNIRRFVFASSIAVYGKNQLPMKENLIPYPEDPYAIAKRTIELDLAAAYKLFGMEYTIFRLHNVYGEKQNHGDPYRNVLGIFINNIISGKPLVIFGDGKQKRAFTHIDDVAPYIVQSVGMKKTVNQIYNLGADKVYSVISLARVVLKLMNSGSKIEFHPARKEVRFAYSDHSKIKNDFRIKKYTDLEKGLERMIEWSKKIGPRKTKKFKNIEIKKNLPPSWRKIIK
jgi:UDP-glucose 4-epimerase